MAAIPGRLDEWVQLEDGRWHRPDHPEDGIITLREGLSFADYYARRAEPEPAPAPDPRDAKIADLEQRLARLETASTLTRT